MDSQQLKKLFKTRDRVLRVISKDGFFRVAILKNSNTAQEAKKRHNLDVMQAALLARHLSAASLMASFLKGEERIVVESSSNGPLKSVYAEALQIGEVRGFVIQTDEIDWTQFENIADVWGAGLLRVSRVLYDNPEPSESYVPLTKGDVATDLTYYLTQSDQIPSAVVLDTSFNENEEIEHSGGIIVQAMPGASESAIKEVVDALTNADKLTSYFEKAYTPEDILKMIFPFEFDVIRNAQVDFFCRCSKDKFVGHLHTLTSTEIKEMQADGHNELVCNYCNNKYYLEDSDFAKILEDLQAARN